MASKEELKEKFSTGKKPDGNDFADLIDGVEGPVGKDGEKGPKGDAGEKGEPGPAGEDGFPSEEDWNDLVSRVEALEA